MSCKHVSYVYNVHVHVLYYCMYIMYYVALSNLQSKCIVYIIELPYQKKNFLIYLKSVENIVNFAHFATISTFRDTPNPPPPMIWSHSMGFFSVYSAQHSQPPCYIRYCTFWFLSGIHLTFEYPTTCDNDFNDSWI